MMESSSKFSGSRGDKHKNDGNNSKLAEMAPQSKNSGIKSADHGGKSEDDDEKEVRNYIHKFDQLTPEDKKLKDE